VNTNKAKQFNFTIAHDGAYNVFKCPAQTEKESPAKDTSFFSSENTMTLKLKYVEEHF
jgi:hypothetical protein